jgi:hypothetical protein
MARKTAAKKKTSPTKKTARIRDIVTYRLPSGDREVPAIVTAVEGDKACLTVFDVTGSYVAHGVPHGNKDGFWR